MKTFIRFYLISLVLISLIIFNSCEKINREVPGTGRAEFSVVLPRASVIKSATLPDSTAFSFQILISVEDLAGNAVLTDKLVPLYTFGTEYVSDNVEIKTGEYKLIKFMVINTLGDVVYATPMTGSPLACLCISPLPVNFNILPNQVTKIIPEVISVGDQTPDQFGYASFGFEIIKPLEFWTLCILDNPSLMAPTQITTAKLTVSDSSGWHFTFYLQAAVNHLIIRGGADNYSFSIEKEGFPAQTIQVTEQDLLTTSLANPLILKIPWSSQTKTIVLQPGPKEGKDAMISNLESDKNFGDYEYFEATFLTEPVLTVMRSNRSLISFNLDTLPKSAVIRKVTLKLSYDLPIPFDASYVTDSLPSIGIVWYGGVLQQIIEPWEESSVTWNTQPKTIEVNQVYVPPFIRNANFIELDVTRLFVPAAASVLPNYGMLFRLWPIDRFPGFRFASSDYLEPDMRPKLTITYSL